MPPELLTQMARVTAIEKELMSALEAVPEATRLSCPGIPLDFGASAGY